jgi:hypothetical protein
MKRLVASRFFVALLATIAIVAIAAGVYFYMQYQNSQHQLKSVSVGQETAQLVEKVGKLMELPAGESPTVATVADVSKLKGQPFFANAKNGFKVLIYAQAKKAILYDPFANKIIEVAPVNLGTDQTKATLSPTGTQQQVVPQTTPVVTTVPKPTTTQ